MLQNCLQELGQSNAFPIQLGYEHIFSTVTVQNAKTSIYKSVSRQDVPAVSGNLMSICQGSDQLLRE